MLASTSVGASPYAPQPPGSNLLGADRWRQGCGAWAFHGAEAYDGSMEQLDTVTVVSPSRPLAPLPSPRQSSVGCRTEEGAGFCSSFSMTSYKITSTLHTGVPLFNPPSSSALPARRAFTPSRPGVCSVQLSTPRFSPPTLTRQHAFGSSTLLLHPRPPELIPGWTLPAPLHTSSRLVPYTPRHATRRLYAVSGITRSSPQRRLAS